MQAFISADSHVAEIDETFAEIDPRYRDERPRAIYEADRGGAIFTIPNLPLAKGVPMGLVCAAGRPPEEYGRPVTWEEIHPAGWDPKARLALQDEEGVVSEIIYHSMGMVLCNHPDIDYRKATFDAYNRWILRFAEEDPERLVALPLIGLRTVEEGIAEIEEAKRLGFKGVMLSGNAAFDDYDHPSYDPFWEACIDLGLPVAFHILTTRGDLGDNQRGHKIIQHLITIRGNQDLMAMLIFGGVFARHPDLKVVCVEADAGWVPHFKYRMDHTFERHRHWQGYGSITRPPGEYFDENIYVTFQDDFSVKYALPGMNSERILWASDFPHSDGTYPYSRKVAEELATHMSDTQWKQIFHDNVAELYGITL
ncbi:MAG: amidohydrolase [Deltaproteobacteria bacterium]|jgi:predicted TIM-barrel fold metal-dependent hydrolase|nr:amidohydrolase [Deltaproteobacteria bacterium]